jgi:hypothetical protein
MNLKSKKIGQIIFFIFLIYSFNLVFSQKPNSKDINIINKDSVLVMKYTAVVGNFPYLSNQEKAVIQWLNIARMYPKWYVYFMKLNKGTTENEKSLYKELMKIKAIKIPLIPDEKSSLSAKCHAISSGKVGYVGHDRIDTNCKSNFRGECISYGPANGIDIVYQLLVDEGVPNLGHRKICLSELSTIGISIQNHKIYGSNAVLDFR